MAANFELKVLSPSRTLSTSKVTQVTLPGTEGYMTILPDHAGMVAELGVGEISVKSLDQSTDRYFLSGGYVEVDGPKVTILADIIEKAKEVDLTRAQAAKKRASERLNKISPELDVSRANDSLRRADQRILIAQTLAHVSKS